MAESLYPRYPSETYLTPMGTPYLKSPGVCLIGKTKTDLDGAWYFLKGFDSKLQFNEYLNDPVKLGSAEQLVKFAGQLCYASFRPGRTWNKDAATYLKHIKESGHGSVLEHVNYSFLCFGISRSCTHELVRHRAGAAYSQLSQRYADGKVVRFVERQEYQDDPVLHAMFEKRIDRAAFEYNAVAEPLLAKQAAGDTLLSADRKADLRKKVNQVARSVLPNETEAPIVVTLNCRALRHVLEMRASPFAETEIRKLGYLMFRCVRDVSPMLFEDYKEETLPDGTMGITTSYKKV